nr:UDP-glycosyltransferase 87A1-like [Ipomoea batatas]
MGSRVDPDFSLHIVAIPFPGRGHVNPLLNLCKIIAMARPEFLITFVVTEEWLGFLSSDDDAKPANLRFGAIHNVIPSELIRAKVYTDFLKAVYTEMEAPVDRLLDSLAPPGTSVIIYDLLLSWVVGIGNRRNIPVASFWPQSPTMFSIAYHYQLLLVNGHVDADLAEKGDEVVDYIPGVSSILVKDLPPLLHAKHPAPAMRSLFLDIISTAQEAQYLLFTSVADLESAAIEALTPKLKPPIYSIGTAIPNYLPIHGETCPDYLTWLDAQPACSVLYISQGSFLSLSAEQLEEIVAGVHESGVRFFWVARENTERRRREAGVNSAVLTNSKMIVDDWKIGWKVKKGCDDDGIVRRREIAEVVRRFMGSEGDESKELKRRAKKIGEMCRLSLEGGSAKHSLHKFIEDISRNRNT